MPSPTLFPPDESLTPSESLAPSSERKEPALWLKRIVILPELHSDSPIRDIAFRRGLNIVQTRQRKAGESAVVGHSVGKTLLMRLIRYTLGEHHFAVEHVRTRIANRFGSAQVVAHWKVKDVDWIVVRPMQEARSSKSFAIKADDWCTAIRDDQAHKPLAEFLAEVNAAVLSGLEDFNLPRARRSPKWLDILGWLARDYECGYLAPNEWRHPDADSGSGLDRDDNSLILQWMADLMASDEIALKHRHQELLDARQAAKANRESAQRTIDVTGPALFAKLELPPDSQFAEVSEGLFVTQVIKTADDKIASLNRLIDERRENSSLASLEAAAESARDKLNDAEAEVRAVASQIKFVNGRIEILEKAGLKSVYAVRSPFEDCTYSACPMRLANRPTPASDPAKDQHLEFLCEELAEHERLLPVKQSNRDTLQTAYNEAMRTVQNERKRLNMETSGIDRDIGRWQGYRSDAKRYTEARETLSESDKTIARLDAKIEESYQAQEIVRQNLRDRLNRLSECYARILKEIFGSEASGKISVDGKGLHPIPDSRLAPNGAALSIMTTVLAFDVASVVAGIAGIGHHPRLLLHDSPREGDMEEPLFHRLFEVVRELESLFGDDEPSFQYIVTTTTPPPPELADENGPFVRLTLDARNDADHLLCASF